MQARLLLNLHLRNWKTLYCANAKQNFIQIMVYSTRTFSFLRVRESLRAMRRRNVNCEKSFNCFLSIKSPEDHCETNCHWKSLATKISIINNAVQWRETRHTRKLQPPAPDLRSPICYPLCSIVILCDNSSRAFVSLLVSDRNFHCPQYRLERSIRWIFPLLWLSNEHLKHNV